jgi:NADPH-dependent curcumin reductase
MPTMDDFGLETIAVDDVPADHVVVKVDTLSMDAWIRTTLNQAGMHERGELGSTIQAFGVGEVVESNSGSLAVGDKVYGMLCAQTHALVPAAAMKKLDLPEGIKLRDYIGPLGITTGLTAWVGLIAVGEVKAGDVVLVSGAAGAVGSVVVQLAKARGAFVIGIAGGPEKCRYVLETIRADAAIDYKGSDVSAELAKVAPNGINVFFDNVGGELLDIALDNLAAAGARVSICGAISQYADLNNVQGPKLYLRLAERNATMKGFVVSHYAAQFPAAIAEISDLLRTGKMNLPEHVVEGIERFPDALFMLFGGAHVGNLVVRP